MDLSKTVTQLKSNPTVKKLRAFEQSRMAKMTAKQAARKQQLQQNLESVKTVVIEHIKTQADDLLELAKILEAEDDE